MTNTQLIVVSCLLLLLFGGVGIAGGKVVHSDSAGEAELNNVTVAADLLESANENETVQALVTLADDGSILADESAGSYEQRLKTQAQITQEPVIEALDSFAGVEIENEFWITNAIQVTVDTDETELEALSKLDQVTAIHSNTEVEAAGATAPIAPQQTLGGFPVVEH